HHNATRRIFWNAIFTGTGLQNLHSRKAHHKMKQKCIHYKLKRKLLRKMHVEPISSLFWYTKETSGSSHFMSTDSIMSLWGQDISMLLGIMKLQIQNQKPSQQPFQ
ncbi:hypothetical protein PanWU01x14_224600, partial [Parasponia andersonii]